MISPCGHSEGRCRFRSMTHHTISTSVSELTIALPRSAGRGWGLVGMDVWSLKHGRLFPTCRVRVVRLCQLIHSSSGSLASTAAGIAPVCFSIGFVIAVGAISCSLSKNYVLFCAFGSRHSPLNCFTRSCSWCFCKISSGT